MRIPFFERFEGSKRILIAGAGGGFDFVGGIPLATWAKDQGKEVVFANLSFSRLGSLVTERIGPAGWIVERTSSVDQYFPERHMVDWFATRGWDPTIVGFTKKGVVPLRETYEAVVERYGIDTIVLIDGGTDSVVKGDDPSLATIAEDATSIVAVDGVTGVERKLFALIGFGVDAYHGIAHHSFLENTAEALRAGGYLGSVSVMAGTPEGDAYLEAVDFVHARQPNLRSIVCDSVASAMRGHFGNEGSVDRSRLEGSELFINPLMAQYWTYDLGCVVGMMGFAHLLRDTEGMGQAVDRIRSYRETVPIRKRVALPL